MPQSQGFLGTIGWIKGNLMSNPDLLDKNYSNETFYPGAPNIPNSAEEALARILPTDIAGLCLCLDSEINSRQGIHDESINGMQNLVYTPITGNASTTGCLEKLNGTPTFSDKGIKLGGTCFYPAYGYDDLTVELCMQLGEPVDINRHHWVHVNGSGGADGRICIIVDSEVVGFYGLKSSTNMKSVHAKHSTDKKIHYAVTSKLTAANSTKVYINGSQVQPEAEAQFNTYSDKAATTLVASNYNASFGGMSSVGTSSIPYNADTMYAEGAFWCPNDTFYSFRVWSRQLTPEEIQANYQADKRRFG